MTVEVESMHASLLGHDLPERLNRDARALGVPAPPDMVTEDEIAGLPATEQRYLRFMGVVGCPAVTSFRAHLRGEFRMRPGQGFMRAEVWQYNMAAPIARVFWMRIDMAGGLLPMVGRDSYIKGRGRMLGKLFDTVVVADVEGFPFAIGDDDRVEELAQHATATLDVAVPTHHRQEPTGHVDPHPEHPRDRRGHVVLPHLGSHEALPRPHPELAAQVRAERRDRGASDHPHEPEIALLGRWQARNLVLGDHVRWCRNPEGTGVAIEALGQIMTQKTGMHGFDLHRHAKPPGRELSGAAQRADLHALTT